MTLSLVVKQASGLSKITLSSSLRPFLTERQKNRNAQHAHSRDDDSKVPRLAERQMPDPDRAVDVRARRVAVESINEPRSYADGRNCAAQVKSIRVKAS
jgi:hypothetical protein